MLDARPQRSPLTSRPDRFVGPLLDLYERGEFQEATQLLRTIKTLPDEVETIQVRNAPVQSVPSRVSIPAFDVFARSFENLARAWVGAQGPDKRTYRLKVAALAVLEAADAGGFSGFSQFRSATEWICSEFRKAPQTPYEHQWQLAVVAMAHSGGGAEFLIRQKDGADHLKHAVARYPGEVRFSLAVPLNEMITRVANNRPGVRLVDMVRRSDIPDERSASKFIDRVLGQLDRLATTPGIAEEALMRAGVIRFQIGEFDIALANLSQAAKSDDRFVQYMSHLFEGKTLEALDRRSAALSAYESAYRSDPQGQSAALQFAAVLFTNGRRDEAMAIVEDAVRDRDEAIADWWYVYGSGDYRFWNMYRRQLREALRN